MWARLYQADAEFHDGIRVVETTPWGDPRYMDGVNALRGPDRAMLVITHYQRLLDHIVPDRVHVLAHGRIQRSGGKELALELEARGYAEFGADEAA